MGGRELPRPRRARYWAVSQGSFVTYLRPLAAVQFVDK